MGAVPRNTVIRKVAVFIFLMGKHLTTLQSEPSMRSVESIAQRNKELALWYVQPRDPW